MRARSRADAHVLRAHEVAKPSHSDVKEKEVGAVEHFVLVLRQRGARTCIRCCRGIAAHKVAEVNNLRGGASPALDPDYSGWAASQMAPLDGSTGYHQQALARQSVEMG